MKKILIPILAVIGVAFCYHFGMYGGMALATSLVTLAGAPMLSNKEQIEALASNFSNYDDDYDDFTGRPHKLLTTGVFAFGISNSAIERRDFYIYSGYQLDAMGFGNSFGAGAAATRYGQMVDGAFRAINQTATDLNGSGDTASSINEFLAYVKNCPGNKITKIVVRSASQSVHSQTINVIKKDPLRQLESRPIRLSTWRNPSQYDQNTTIINEVIPLGSQDFIQFSVPASVTDMVIELHLNGYAS